MSCLSCHYRTLASLTEDPSSSSESPQPNNSKLPLRRIKPRKNPRLPPMQQQNRSQQQQQLRIIKLERALGAGTFRDNEPRDVDQKKVVYNGVLPDFSGIFEGAVEKQVRATGEWLSSEAEDRLRSSRKGILMVGLLCILPIWTLSLLVASGVIKLPFNTPFLDDLIM